MESEPVKQTQSAESQPSPNANEGVVQSALQEVMGKLWDAVRHGADVIVTLRQENAILQSQVASLKHSETGLQKRVDDLLERIEAFDEGVKSGPYQIDRLEDQEMVNKIHDLESTLEQALAERSELDVKLAKAEKALVEIAQQLDEHRDVSQQVLQLRSELEMRAQLLQELQEGFVDREMQPQGTYTIQLEEERDRLTAELDRALAIVQKYRAAGLRHIESTDSEDQLALFLHEADQVASEPALSLEQVAERLENIALQLEQLAELS